MKQLNIWYFPVFLLSVLTLQSCALTGNKASKATGTPVVQRLSNEYYVDIQKDTNLRMVYLTNYLQPFNADWPYAGTANFTGTALYKRPGAFLRAPAARALKAVQAEMRQLGLGIRIFDAYRPYSVTKKMWAIVPDERYAANPARGSGHNRGIAVDLTLFDLATGQDLAMPTAFDDFSEKAHHDYTQLDSLVVRNRRILRQVMEKHGFKALETEWWHYFLPDGGRYPLMDFDFNRMRRLVRRSR